MSRLLEKESTVFKQIRTKLLGFSLLIGASVLITSPLPAETIVNGVVYPEITDLGSARVTRSQPQLGYDASAPRQAAYTAQLPPPPNYLTQPVGYSAADSSPTLAPVNSQPLGTQTYAQGSIATPYAQSSVATPYAYGYGYTSVGTPQKVVQVVQPIGYTNSLPQQQITYVQPTFQPVAYTQPSAAIQPLNSVQGTTAFNPYVQTKGVPWRPIVPIRSMPANYVVGQGIIGQPKVYVPSQPVRNFIRYISP